MSEKASVGSVTWTDLTVENAERIRDFYSAVVGWTASGVDMGGYDDFNMNDPETGTPVAGVCHARGGNADLPPVWLIYVNVEDIEKSFAKCVELGGQVISGPKRMGGQGRYCVIRDPAGAALALFEPAK
ncbi:MAG TPA: VOC family protein [Blastocatellia bacterium]|jgi:Predicted enzyme related to lactoylglutathione lyase